MQRAKPTPSASPSTLPALSAIFGLLLILCASAGHALPIGFGKNQGDQVYHELRSDNFFIYFDKDAPHEAAGIMRSLEAGKPVIEYWLGISRIVPMPIIMSSMTSNASFANFITDAIELQTRGKGGRDLAWHEFVHSTMYLHLDNFLGPAGSILYLPFMPAWWIEGLAETIAMSHGQDGILAVERHAAINDAFPSFDRMHRLYDGSSFARMGYGISASFVTYIFEQYGYDKLVPIFKDFYRYAQPWYWPWAAVPFNGFLPMDEALRNATGKDARELYLEYKQAKREYWLKKLAGTGAASRYTYEDVWYSPRLSSMDGRVSATFAGAKRAGTYDMYLPPKAKVDTAMTFSKGLQPRVKLPKGTLELLSTRRHQVRLTERKGVQRLELWLPKGAPVAGKLHWQKKLATRSKKTLSRLAITETSVSYLYHGLEDSGFCYRRFDKFTKEYCPLSGKGPVTIAAIDNLSSGPVRWLRRGVETVDGTLYTMLRFNTATFAIDELAVNAGGKPLQIKETPGGGFWLLAATYKGRRFRRLTSEGRCVKEAHLPYASRQFEVLGPHTLVVDGFSPEGSALIRVNISTKPFVACEPSFARMSPLLYQLASGEALGDDSFARAMTAAGLGRTVPADKVPVLTAAMTKQAAALQKANSEPMTKARDSRSGEERARSYIVTTGQKAKLRLRPVFALPWIGTDSQGLTIGTVSVPLMDHRQNHTLRLNFLYGLNSRFPGTELHYRNTRYRPTINLKLFRYETYNGSWRFNDDPYQAYYYDEIGMEVSAGRAVLPWLSLGLGARFSRLEPYIGPASFFDTPRQGTRMLLTGNFTAGTSLGPFYLGLGGSATIVPEALNEAWDYQKYRLATKVTLPFRLLARTHHVSYGLQLGVTEGNPAKTPLLRETYRPLQTHIPGGGGVNNQFHFSIVGLGGLTDAKNGDRSYRNEFIYTAPVFPDLDTLWGIFYLERIDFSLFYNYGNAWYDRFPASRGDPVQAIGYAFDLQADVKGVALNFGLGAGRVLGEELAYYGQFGFNALID